MQVGGFSKIYFLTYALPTYREPTTSATMGQTISDIYYGKKKNEKTPLTYHDFAEREVKKANRELNNLTSRMDDMQKIEILQKRVTEHLADMKRLERENLKNKKRGDILQKEKDLARTDLSKTNILKDKLEKLCRELQRENNRLKVCYSRDICIYGNADWLDIE